MAQRAVATAIYSFRNGSDGDFPQAGLVIDKQGSLYGTTFYGGPGSCDGGCGTVFKLTPSGSGYDESILYAFKDYVDGYLPFAAVTLGAQKTRARDIHSRTAVDGCEPRNSHDRCNCCARASSLPRSGPSPITTVRAFGWRC